jgi:hypothetical protein
MAETFPEPPGALCTGFANAADTEGCGTARGQEGVVGLRGEIGAQRVAHGVGDEGGFGEQAENALA